MSSHALTKPRNPKQIYRSNFHPYSFFKENVRFWLRIRNTKRNLSVQQKKFLTTLTSHKISKRLLDGAWWAEMLSYCCHPHQHLSSFPCCTDLSLPSYTGFKASSIKRFRVLKLSCLILIISVPLHPKGKEKPWAGCLHETWKASAVCEFVPARKTDRKPLPSQLPVACVWPHPDNEKVSCV